jgi:hypothetical protein
MPGDDSAERKHAPATLRNREPIAEVLHEELPVTGKVLEVASGSGEHCAFFAELFPGHGARSTLGAAAGRGSRRRRRRACFRTHAAGRDAGE